MEYTNATPSEDALITATNEILKDCDVTLLTLKGIKQQLEARFQCALPESKGIIRSCLEKFMEETSDDYLYEAKVKSEEENEPIEPRNTTLKKRSGGFGAAVQLAPDLAEFLGESEMPRTEVTKRVWAYIKQNNLQNPADKREILCDATLQKILKKPKIHMFKMTKVLSTMMYSEKDIQNSSFAIEDSESDDDEDDDDSSNKKTKVKKEIKKESSTASASKRKRDAEKDNKKQKNTPDKKAKKEKVKREKKSGGGEEGQKKSAFMKDYEVNPALANLIGVDTHCSRPQIVKFMWVYIKAHNLQNPADGREILLDAPLRSVFKADKCTIFSINKLISGQLSDIVE